MQEYRTGTVKLETSDPTVIVAELAVYAVCDAGLSCPLVERGIMVATHPFGAVGRLMVIVAVGDPLPDHINVKAPAVAPPEVEPSDHPVPTREMEGDPCAMIPPVTSSVSERDAGMSEATKARKLGAAAEPEAGPANTKLVFCALSEIVIVPDPVIGEPETLIQEGTAIATLVTVPPLPETVWFGQLPLIEIPVPATKLGLDVPVPPLLIVTGVARAKLTEPPEPPPVNPVPADTLVIGTELTAA
jgi:hypothetical protein